MRLAKEYTMEQLFELAFKDILTGTYNRNALEEKRAAYDAACVWVYVVDIDNLKLINDTYGHEAGDAVIKSVAQQLLSISPEVVRLGGDEFLMFTQQRVVQPIIGASYGGILKPRDMCLSIAMHAADKAMYEIKQRRLGNVQ